MSELTTPRTPEKTALVVAVAGAGGSDDPHGITSPHDEALMKRKRAARPGGGALPLDFPTEAVPGGVEGMADDAPGLKPLEVTVSGGGGVDDPMITSPLDDALMKKKRSSRPGGGGGLPLNLPLGADSTDGPVATAIKECLGAVLNPAQLHLVDDSAAHKGHAGAKGYSGESHFVLEVVSDAFSGLSRVKRHQLVYGSLVHPMLGDLMATKVHALNIKAQTVAEHHAASGAAPGV